MAAEDPVAVCDAVGHFAEWALEKAMLVPGEFPEEALLFQGFSYYYGEVVNGGHPQFVKNSLRRNGEMEPAMLARVDRLLDTVGAREHHGVFRDFVAFLDGMAGSDRRELASRGLEDLSRRFGQFDNRFFGSEDEEALWERVRRWVLGLPTLRMVPAGVLEAERAAIIAANPLRDARFAAAEAEQAEAEAKDPVFSAMKTLSAAAGLEFVRFTSGDPRGLPAYYRVSFVTSGGRRSLQIRDGRAYLMDGDGASTGHSCECPAKFDADGGWS